MSFSSSATQRSPAVAAVVCSEYDLEAVERTVREAVRLAGIGPDVLPKGGTVLVKPNLVSPHAPEKAVTTHPVVVAAVARLCREWGAARVWIADSPAGAHSETRLWQKTEMTAAAELSGATLKSMTEGPVRACACGPETVPVPAWLSEVDSIVSVPKLKTHGLTGLTCAMKNTFGLVVGSAKSMLHARCPAPRSLSRALVDIWEHLRADVTIVDAVTAMEGQGPTNGDPVPLGIVLAGTNAAALDAVCSRILPGGETAVPMVQEALARSLCSAPDLIRTVGDGMEVLRRTRLRPSVARFLVRIPTPVFQWATYVLAAKPRVVQRRCVRCGTCAEVCSAGAVVRDPATGRFRIDRRRCILCMCCMESCPEQAIRVRSPLVWLSQLPRWLRKGDCDKPR